jgi:isochorismate hydrolase
MNESDRLPRSPELMSRDDSALLVVDVQGKLVSLIPDYQRLVWNIRRLIDGAKILGVAVSGTEQYPQGLGPTIEVLASRLGKMPAKMTFSCGGCPQVFDGFRDAGIYKLLVVGIEAHVCIQQTVLDALADGFQVYLAVDAIGARHDVDYQTALRRMESSGAVLTTTEAALFEWCDVSGTAEFKQISALVRETEPTDA